MRKKVSLTCKVSRAHYCMFRGLNSSKAGGVTQMHAKDTAPLDGQAQWPCLHGFTWRKDLLLSALPNDSTRVNQSAETHPSGTQYKPKIRV